MVAPKRYLPWWKRSRKEKDKLNAAGQEVLSGTPRAQTLNLKDAPRVMSIRDQVIQAIHSKELEARMSGLETFEEASDFDVPDEEDWQPESPWEDHFDAPDLVELLRREKEMADDARREAQRDDGTTQGLIGLSEQEASGSQVQGKEPVEGSGLPDMGGENS